VAPQLKQLSEADPSSINAKNIHLFDVSEGLDYSKLQPLEIQELKEWWRKAKGTVAQNVSQVQKHWGYFPRNKELDLYGFGLKSPDEGGRPRWNQKIYPRVQFEKKGWNTDSTAQQVIFEDWLRTEHNLCVSTRSHGSQPTSAAASPRLPSTSSLPRIGPATSPLISTTAAPSVTPPQEHSDDEDDNGETLDFHTPAPPGPERRAGPSFELGLTTEASETTLDTGRRTPPPPDPSLPSSSDEDDTMAAQPTVALKNTSKVNPPRDFDGDVANTNNFIREVKLYKRLKPDDFSDDDGWLYWALSYMRGSKFVEAWAAAVMDENDKTNPDPASEYFIADWDAFIAKVKNVFGDPDEAGTAREDLKGLRQKDNETVDQFFFRFREVASKTKSSPEDLFEEFKSKVKGYLATRVASHDPEPSTLANWAKKAAAIERQLKKNPATSTLLSRGKGSSQRQSSGPRVSFNPRSPDGPRVSFSSPSSTSTQGPSQGFAPSISQGYRPGPSRIGPSDQSAGRMSSITCWFCKKQGHISSKCPDKKSISAMTQQEIIQAMYHYQDMEKQVMEDFVANLNLVDSGPKDGTTTLDEVDEAGLDFQIEDE
jgi:hypothetical protein